jgi:hypothetical protein
MEAAYRQYHVNGTWWAGDPAGLSALYDGQGTGWDRVDTRYRASQFRGGVVGKVARWFWGAPPADGELRAKLHLPLAADIACLSANMLFAEPPKLHCENEKTQARLDVLTDDGDLQSRSLAAAEVGAAIGDVYPVVTWDKAIRDYPWIRYVHGDAVVPEWRGDVLSAATIWTVVREEDGGKVWRHLERHEKGVIFHGLYRGDSQTLGAAMDLREVESLAHLAEVVETGVDRILVDHVPNLLPNRLDRGSPLGRSLLSPAVLGLMDGLDEIWSSLSRDFRLAKARAVITEDAVKSLGSGQGAVFDDREILMPLRINPNHQGVKPVELIQPLIRVEQHIAGAQALTGEIVRSCGYSPLSFGLGRSEQAAATATEIQQRERQSYLTRGMQTLHWGGGLRRSLHVLLEVDAAVFGSGVSPERPTLEFGDTIAESDATTAATLNLLTQAQSASIETRVRILHPEWDDPRVAQEVAGIKEENGLGDVPNPEDVVRGLTKPAPGMPAAQPPAIPGQPDTIPEGAK